jgi:NAD(P)H-dependent FMN reductase
MKIAIINGSPKKKGSASEAIVAALLDRLTQADDLQQAADPPQAAGLRQADNPVQSTNPRQAVECVVCHAARQGYDEIMASLAGSNALVFVFPLYVDGIPSHLLRLLDGAQETIAGTAPGARVYGIVNSGFYEAHQNDIALEQLEICCTRCGLAWGQGLGVGGGGMTLSAPIGHGPMQGLGRALDTLAGTILSGKTADRFFVEPGFPKFLYQMGAHTNWRLEARRHGLKTRQLYRRPQAVDRAR